MLERHQIPIERVMVAVIEVMAYERTGRHAGSLKSEVVEPIIAEIRTRLGDGSAVPMSAVVDRRKRRGVAKAVSKSAMRIEVDGPLGFHCGGCGAARGEPCRDENGEITDRHEARLELQRASEIPQRMAG